MNTKKIALSLLLTLLIRPAKAEDINPYAAMGAAFVTMVGGYSVLLRYVAPKMADASATPNIQAKIEKLEKKIHNTEQFEVLLETQLKPVRPLLESLQAQLQNPATPAEDKKIALEKLQELAIQIQPIAEKIDELKQKKIYYRKKIQPLKNESSELTVALADTLFDGWSKQIPHITLDEKHHA